MTPTTKRAIPELSVDTQILVKRLMSLPIGEMILYEELSALIGRDIRQQPVRGLLRSARHIVLRDEQIVTEAVRGEGLKRLDDVGIAQLGDQHIARTRRACRRTAMKLVCVQKFEALSDELKAKHNTAMGVIAVLSAATRPQFVKRLEGKIAEQLPLAKMLDAIKGSLSGG